MVCVFEFRENKIAREPRYHLQPFEAPQWRTQWVERMNDAGAATDLR